MSGGVYFSLIRPVTYASLGQERKFSFHNYPAKLKKGKVVAFFCRSVYPLKCITLNVLTTHTHTHKHTCQ